MAIPAEVLKASIAQAGGVIVSISQLEEQILRAADLITNCLLLEGRKAEMGEARRTLRILQPILPASL